MIIGAYKAILIKALEVETFTLSLNLYIERLVACIVARIHTTKAVKGIKSIYNWIHQQIIDRRERLVIPYNSLLDYINA
jgi:hypothetical protein